MNNKTVNDNELLYYTFKQTTTGVRTTSLLKSSFLQLVICRTCSNLLKQLAVSLQIPSLDNQLATSLLRVCNRLTSIRCQQTCYNLHVFGCVLNMHDFVINIIYFSLLDSDWLKSVPINL